MIRLKQPGKLIQLLRAVSELANRSLRPCNLVSNGISGPGMAVSERSWADKLTTESCMQGRPNSQVADYVMMQTIDRKLLSLAIGVQHENGQ